MSTATDQRRQRRLDDLLAAARSAERHLETVAKALRALQPDELREAGLDTVHYHDLLDASQHLGTAKRSLEDIQGIAVKHGAKR